jgi:anthranilate phosphoribosyltransferase
VRLRQFTWQPEDFGIQRTSLEHLKVKNPAESAAVIHAILNGNAGPARDIVVLNAAAGLIVAGKANDPKQAALTAAHAIDSGAARRQLAELVKRSHAQP